MEESVLWIFLCFFAVLGLCDFVHTIVKLFTAPLFGRAVVVLPVKKETDGLEHTLASLFSDWSDSLPPAGSCVIADVGMDEHTRQTCEQIAKPFGVEVLSTTALTNQLQSIATLEEHPC